MKFLKYVEKWIKNVENDLEIMRNGQNIWENPQIYLTQLSEADLLCWNWLKNLISGLNMYEMTYIFGKWLKCLRNG